MKYELRAREDGGVDVADKDGCVFASLIGLCASGGIKARDRFFTEGDLMIWERETGEPVTEMVMEMHFREPCAHMTIPAVLYDGNPVGSDHEYKGFFHEGEPYVIAGHRTSVPAGSCSEGQRHSTAMWSEGNASVSLFPVQEGSVHRVIWPLMEGPRVLMSDGWGEAYREEMEPQRLFRVFIAFGGVGRESAQRAMLSSAFRQALSVRPAMKPISRKKLWEDSVSYAKRLYTEEEDGFCGYAIGLLWDGEKWVKRRENRYEAAWCGQNISLAVSLLVQSRLFGDDEARRMAEKVLASWLARARSRQGFYLTRYGNSESDPIDACNLGDYVCQLLLVCSEKELSGLSYSDEEQAALEILNFSAPFADEHGAPSFWRQDGTVLSREGFGGAFLIPAFAEGYRRFKDDLYLEKARELYEFYAGLLRKQSFGTSAALDTACVDKESAIPLLKGGIRLYEITSDASYLGGAEDAAWYLSSWQWHQTNVMRPGSGLERLHYDTFGGTAVSTSHHHMDAYALSYVPALFELARLTGRTEWAERAEAAFRNGIQGISDGTLTLYDGDIRPRGSSDEGFVHTNWGRVTKGPGLWNDAYETTRWLVAWPCAFRLEVLRGGLIHMPPRHPLLANLPL